MPVLRLEVRSVNSRFLDLTFKLQDELRSSEPALRELLSKHLKRGKVETRAWLEKPSGNGIRVPSTIELQKIVTLQDSIQIWCPKAAPLSVSEILHLTIHQDNTPKFVHDQLLTLAQTVLEGLIDARQREGTRLALMLQDRLQQLRQLAQDAQPLIPQLVAQQRQRFLDRWSEALSGTLNADLAQERALAEATAFAIRVDVAEELSRLESHLSEIERLLDKGGEIGKRIDFLIQELHREANTLGSKSSSLELTCISVEMRVLIEQMREQIQNLE